MRVATNEFERMVQSGDMTLTGHITTDEDGYFHVEWPRLDRPVLAEPYERSGAGDEYDQVLQVVLGHPEYPMMPYRLHGQLPRFQDSVKLDGATHPVLACVLAHEDDAIIDRAVTRTLGESFQYETAYDIANSLNDQYGLQYGRGFLTDTLAPAIDQARRDGWMLPPGGNNDDPPGDTYEYFRTHYGQRHGSVHGNTIRLYDPESTRELVVADNGTTLTDRGTDSLDSIETAIVQAVESGQMADHDAMTEAYTWIQDADGLANCEADYQYEARRRSHIYLNRASYDYERKSLSADAFADAVGFDAVALDPQPDNPTEQTSGLSR